MRRSIPDLTGVKYAVCKTLVLKIRMNLVFSYSSSGWFDSYPNPCLGKWFDALFDSLNFLEGRPRGGLCHWRWLSFPQSPSVHFEKDAAASLCTYLIFVWICAFICLCACVRARTYVYLYLSIYLSIYLSVYVYIHIYIYLHLHLYLSWFI